MASGTDSGFVSCSSHDRYELRSSSFSRIQIVPEVEIPVMGLQQETDDHDQMVVAPQKRELEESTSTTAVTVTDGVALTWEDLWVTVSNGNKGSSRSILQGLTGYARPGQLLAIMGPSGCGKSTLLDSLAGRLDSNAR